MANPGYTDQQVSSIIETYKEIQSKQGTANKLGLSRNPVVRVIENWLKTPEGEAWRADSGPGPLASQLEAYAARVGDPLASRTRGGRVYIFTSAQNNTILHEGLWENLTALATHDDAKIVVGRFIYRKDAMGQAGQEKKHDAKAEKRVEWDARIMPYVIDDRLQIAPDLVWCGEMNTLPTADKPLAGLDNYTGTKSAIFPHTKIEMRSIATVKSQPAKHTYTTGAITRDNYIQRKVGIKAQFHHVCGALIVEVSDDGKWWVRQINASSDGSFYDLDRRVENGKVTTGHALEAINWGDIHVHHLEPWMREACWGQDGILDQLRPRFQFFHDTLDFHSRSHHDIKDAHEMYERYVKREDSVKNELTNVIAFLDYAERQFCQSVVVESNHDNAYLRWVKEASHKNDPPNAVFLLQSQLACFEAIDDGNDKFHLFEWALRKLGYKGSARFLDENDSFVICPNYSGGIECALHGHRGPKGRGTVMEFVKMGMKMNIGHGHGALILFGLFMAGVMGSLDQGYNKGPSDWSHSFIATYPNGKRAMVTLRGPRCRL